MVDDSKLLEKIKKSLDNSLENIDASTQQNLRMAREKALAALDKKTDNYSLVASIKSSRLLIGGVAMASVAILVVTVSVIISLAVNDIGLVEDDMYVKVDAASPSMTLEMLASDEAPDFYDDMEFYHWLSEKVNSNAS